MVWPWSEPTNHNLVLYLIRHFRLCLYAASNAGYCNWWSQGTVNLSWGFTRLRCANMVEQIEVLLEMATVGDPMNIVLDEGSQFPAPIRCNLRQITLTICLPWWVAGPGLQNCVLNSSSFYFWGVWSFNEWKHIGRVFASLHCAVQCRVHNAVLQCIGLTNDRCEWLLAVRLSRLCVVLWRVVLYFNIGAFLWCFVLLSS